MLTYTILYGQFRKYIGHSAYMINQAGVILY